MIERGPIAVLELYLPDGSCLRREFEDEGLPAWLMGPRPEWLIGATKTWEHPQEPVVFRAHVLEGFEDRAREAMEQPAVPVPPVEEDPTGEEANDYTLAPGTTELPKFKGRRGRRSRLGGP